MNKLLPILLTVALCGCGASSATDPIQIPPIPPITKFNHVTLEETPSGTMLIIRDLGVKHPTFVEFTFRLGAYVVGTAAHPENGHIALGIGQILNPISNDYMKAIAEGFLIGNSKTFPVEAARCLESTDSGAYLLRESYYSPLILDAATCIGPLDPAKYYTAYVTISADYAVELRLTEADSGVMVGMKRSSYNGVHEKAAMGFFLIPLPSSGKYDLKKLNVGELR